MRIVLALVVAFLADAAFANPAPDALTLLKNTVQRYTDATSYHIEAIEERVLSTELSRDWEKQLLVAVVAPGGNYRYEGKSGHGSGMLISDGKTHWVYHIDEHLYTRTPTSTTENHQVMLLEEIAAWEAKRLVTDITTLSSRVGSATFVPDQVLELNGRKINCYVIHIGANDFRKRPTDLKKEETLWIDQSDQRIVKREIQEDSYTLLPPSGVHIPLKIETTILYPVVRLGGEEPLSSFTFSPPTDVTLVESFPNTVTSAPPGDHSTDFVGKQAPDIRLKASDGKLIRLSSLRGKPVFIEFWATWCGPCMDLVPALKGLYSETSESMVWLSIDSDEDPTAATTYLSQEHIRWSNYHDADGSLGKAFGRNGIPLAVIIDSDGNVTFYKSGYDINDLRTAIAKLHLPLQGMTTSGVPESK